MRTIDKTIDEFEKAFQIFYDDLKLDAKENSFKMFCDSLLLEEEKTDLIPKAAEIYLYCKVPNSNSFLVIEHDYNYKDDKDSKVRYSITEWSPKKTNDKVLLRKRLVKELEDEDGKDMLLIFKEEYDNITIQ